MTENELHWLAGLLEGEGSFLFANGCSPTISLQMADKDVIERAASIMGVRLRSPYISPKPNTKTLWICGAHGDIALHLMQELLPLMGHRRAHAIESVLEKSALRPGRGNHPRNRGTTHPNHKLNPVAVRVIRFLWDAGFSKSRLARAYKVSLETIRHVVTKYSWKHVEDANV